MGTPIEKIFHLKLSIIFKRQLVTTEELLTIYEWPEKLMTKELKKLALQQKVEKLQYLKEILAIKMPRI